VLQCNVWHVLGSDLQNNIKEVRQLACVRGLVDHLLRRRVWPLLLGIEAHHTDALPCKLVSEPSSRSARDEQTIRNDVARCLHQSQIDVGDLDREDLREALVRLLRAVVDANTVFYYQVCCLFLEGYPEMHVPQHCAFQIPPAFRLHILEATSAQERSPM
jgi:hypothetical protein